MTCIIFVNAPFSYCVYFLEIAMRLKIAIQMDPIELVDINADSSFRIMEEAQLSGHELFYYNPEQIAFEEGEVTAYG